MDIYDLCAICGLMSFVFWMIAFIVIAVKSWQEKNRAQLKYEIIEEMEKKNGRS